MKMLATLVTAAILTAGLVLATSAGAGKPPHNGGGPKCETKKGTVFLDQAPANVDNSDRKVTFCHATSSAKNPFVVITTSVNACRAHETHTKQPKGGSRDIFPTGGCQD